MTYLTNAPQTQKVDACHMMINDGKNTSEKILVSF